MASDTRTLLGRVLTQLRTINGAGGYVNDVSATDHVSLNAGVTPDLLPSLGVFLESVRSEQVAGREPLGFYRRNWRIQILGFCQSNSDANGDRLLAATDLLDDISTAMEADRFIGGSVSDLIVHGEAFSGSEDDMPTGVATALVTLECWQRQRTGM